VCNLYPFRSDPSVELIDIGGPTMVRAAAKNFAHVGVVVSPADYAGVLDELRGHGSLSDETRRRLARGAFAHTAAYDAAIVRWLDDGELLAPTIHLTLERAEVLRYGENPHQHGARYRVAGETTWWDGMVKHSGSALSYLNLFDTDAAWRLVHELASDAGRPAVAIIKHANPCGAAVGLDLVEAYRLALDCDPLSAFGGVVAVGGVIRRPTSSWPPPSSPTPWPAWSPGGSRPGSSRRRPPSPRRPRCAASAARCSSRRATACWRPGPTGRW
jgi:phosphoribosylaminoimidazolecarboxamide formyltransferase/IMP cyclohydrolase